MQKALLNGNDPRTLYEQLLLAYNVTRARRRRIIDAPWLRWMLLHERRDLPENTLIPGSSAEFRKLLSSIMRIYE